MSKKKHPKHPLLDALKAELAEAKAKLEALESKGECKVAEAIEALKAKIADLKARIAAFGEQVREDFETAKLEGRIDADIDEMEFEAKVDELKADAENAWDRVVAFFKGE